MAPSAMQPLVIYPEGHLAPTASFVVAYGVCACIPALVALVALLLWAGNRLWAMRARAVEESGAPLRPGRAVLRGSVELAQGASLAMRVEIEQLNIYFNKKYVWKETGRRVLCEPFYVRDGRGTRVRVEPTTDAVIIDGLDKVVPIRSDMRLRVADVTQGEEVYVIGTLSTGPDPEIPATYRERGLGPVMRAPARGRLLVASRPPASRFRTRALLHGLWSIGFALLLCLMQAILAFQNVRTIWGETTTGTVESKRHYREKGRRWYDDYWVVRTKTPAGASFEQELEKNDWDKVSDGTQVAVVHVPGWKGFEILGDAPTVDLDMLLPIIAVGGMMLFGYGWHLLAARPWYRRRMDEPGDKDQQPRPEPGVPVHPLDW